MFLIINNFLTRPMRELWRKTAGLFWEKPAIWLPVIVAEFVEQLFELARLHLRNALLPSRSEMFDIFNQPSPGALRLIALSRALALLLTVMVWTCAFVYIAGSVESDKPSIDFALGARLLRARVSRVSLFSVGLFGANALLGAVMLLPMVFSINFPRFARFWGNSQWLMTPLALSMLAFFTAGFALRLLAPKTNFAEKDIINAGVFAMLGVLASQAIMLAGNHANLAVEAAGQFRAFSYLISLLSAFPYTPLFLALGVIASSYLAAEETAARDSRERHQDGESDLVRD